jgi:gamma-glutamyl-gamma-aminobutyrate hydrolase PuuD
VTAPDTAPPVIGVTAAATRSRHGVWDCDVVLLTRTYTDMVLAGGGIPVLLPPVAGIGHAVQRCDGVLLSGGPDVGPDRYGAQAHPRTSAAHPDRDAAELEVLDRALALGLPVLGVCRGLQVLNVGLGGTLHQHLPDVVGHDDHNPTPGVFSDVDVRLDAAGRVGIALGAVAGVGAGVGAGPGVGVGPGVGAGDARLRVRCHHHQAVDRLAPGLVATAWAADGTVEAVEDPARPFVVGVQWHPEEDATDLRLVAALVAAARSR